MNPSLIEQDAPVNIGFPKRICIDFDGVIHQNVSRYTVTHEIADPPVPGAPIRSKGRTP
jgi:hypothetical protein